MYSFDFEAIHARWPAYPSGRGVEYCLLELGAFEVGTHFDWLDSIDHCMLVMAVEWCRKDLDHWDEDQYHIALWQRDLRCLCEKGLIDGIARPPTAAELRQGWSTWYASQERAPPESPDTFDWEAVAKEEAEIDNLPRAWIDTGGFSLSSAGWEAVEALLGEGEDVHPALGRARSLIADGYADVGVREATVVIETELRRRTAGTGKACGQKLVEQYLAEQAESGNGGVYYVWLRRQLRTLFKFVRNPLAHNVDKEMTVGRAVSLLHRASGVLNAMEVGEQGVGTFQDWFLELADNHQKPDEDSDIPF